MATIKIKLYVASSTEKEGTLFYHVIHNRVIRRISSERKLFPQEWDMRHMTIIYPPHSKNQRHLYLTATHEILHEDISRLNGIIRLLEHKKRYYTADDIVESFHQPNTHYLFAAFARSLAEQLSASGKHRMAEIYTTAINSFLRFRKGRDVSLYDIDSNLITAYEAYLIDSGVCPNTTSFYMRNLRAIYNRAVSLDLTIQCFPFKYVYTGIDKTIKRAVPIAIIRKIRHLDLSKRPAMDFARDIFLFSFYTRGTSFIDMAFLKKTDLQNGVLSYRRHKTNQQLRIRWNQLMQDIVDKYDTPSTPFLLPIIRKSDYSNRDQYIKAMHVVNYNLRKIGQLIGLSIPLTTYVARHSWASIAKSQNIAISTISEAMGHNSEKTTRIYLTSFDTSDVDKANNRILKAL